MFEGISKGLPPKVFERKLLTFEEVSIRIHLKSQKVFLNESSKKKLKSEKFRETPWKPLAEIRAWVMISRKCLGKHVGISEINPDRNICRNL